MIFVQNEIFLSVLIDTFLALPSISSVMHRIRQLGRSASKSVKSRLKFSFYVLVRCFPFGWFCKFFVCSKYYNLRPQIRFKVVFSVKFSGSGTESAVCHSSTQPTAIMSDLHVFPEQEEREEQSFYCLEKPQKVSLILARASSSQLNLVNKRDNIECRI